jgi:hypothetical protein
MSLSLHEVVDRHDVRMVEAAMSRGLGLKSIHCVRIFGFFEVLDGHLAPKAGLPSALHDTVPADPNLGRDLVPGHPLQGLPSTAGRRCCRTRTGEQDLVRAEWAQ